MEHCSRSRSMLVFYGYCCCCCCCITFRICILRSLPAKTCAKNGCNHHQHANNIYMYPIRYIRMCTPCVVHIVHVVLVSGSLAFVSIQFYRKHEKCKWKKITAFFLFFVRSVLSPIVAAAASTEKKKNTKLYICAAHALTRFAWQASTVKIETSALRERDVGGEQTHYHNECCMQRQHTMNQTRKNGNK